MAGTIGFGINGLGLIAPFHGKALRDITGGGLVAVCDIAKERADKFGAEYRQTLPDCREYTYDDWHRRMKQQ